MAKSIKNRKGSRPKFIVESPASSDEFGAHDRLAAVISDVLRHDDRIKTIGILGGWGSGKSTVAGLIEKDLAAQTSKSKIHCFTYDAWLHQSDPPRRAFLESLLTYLHDKKEFSDLDVHKETWRNELEKLDGDQRVTKTTVTPTLTGAGRWYVFTLPLVPIGFKLIGKSTISFQQKFDSIAAFGWLLTLAPIIAALGIYAAWRPKASIFSRQFWVTHKASHEKDSILSIVANKHVEIKDEITTGTPEPTAIQFQDIFRRVMNAAHKDTRRIVIIIDNLDRLPPKDAQIFWATVRSFFLGSEGGTARPKRRGLPTVIVPIDDAAFGRMYTQTDDNEDDDGGPDFSSSFLEKTFDLVFHVPVPVLSKWHKYLGGRLATVFGAAMAKHWPHSIGTVYEAWLADGKLRPTPRSINAFVNSIAVSWMQIKDEPVHVAVIAYYAIKQREISKDIYATVTDVNPLLDNFDSEWRLTVAALHFGVGLNDAKEIFMVGPIRSAIAATDNIEFAKLAAVPGFERYFLRLLDALVSGGEPLSAMAIATLLISLPDKGEAWISEAWRKIRHLAISTADSVPYKSGDADGLKAMFSSCDAAERNLFVKSLGKAMEGISPDNLKLAQGKPFAEAVQLLIEQALDDGQKDFQVGVPGGPSEYVTVLLQDVSPRVARSLVPQTVSMKDVLAYLAERFADVVSAYAVVKAATVVAQMGDAELDWVPLLNAAAEALDGEDSTRVGQAAELLKGLYPHVELARDRVSALQSEGTLAKAFGVAWQSDAEDEIANTAALIVVSGGPLQNPDSDWDAKLADTPEVPRLVMEAVGQLGMKLDFGWLIERLSSYSAEAPLLRAISARLLSEDTVLRLNVDRLINDAEKYMEVLPAELESEFWGLASTIEGFWTSQQSMSNERAAPVLRAIINSNVNKSLLGKALQRRFHDTSPEDWDSAIRAGAEPLGLVEALGDLGKSTVIVGPNADAELRTLIPELVETADEDFRVRWFRIAFRLSEASRKTLFKILRDKLVSGVPLTNLLSLLAKGASSFLSDGEFAKKSEPAVLHLILPLSDTEEGRQWLLENFDEISSWFGKSKKKTRTTLLEQLGRLKEQSEPLADQLLERLQTRRR